MHSSHTLVLVRHGESTWNKDNRFTGWTDVPLTPHGVHEATQAGQVLLQKGYSFDVCYTSVLQRAITTFNAIAEEMQCHHIPVNKDYRLNEKSYGALQGLNKKETAQRYGEEQVLLWRRAYDVRPPALEQDHPSHPAQDARYSSVPTHLLPGTESLQDTVSRVLPYWQDTILPTIQSGQRVLIVAHGNSLRSLVKHLDGLSESEVLGLNIPTGVPLVYRLDPQGNKVSSEYLLDQDSLQARLQAVANQGKA